MKKFEVPQMEVVHFGNMSVMTSSPGCDCVECTPCEEGNHCKYVDTCPTYCGTDAACAPNSPM